MKICPKCRYIRKPEEATPEGECPKCGIVYAKFIARLAPAPLQPAVPSAEKAPATRNAPTTEPPPARAHACKECGGRLSPRAAACPHCGDPLGAGSDEMIGSVAIHDITMPFGSMVNFMVKWALAAIPAAIILMLALTIPLMIVGSLLKILG